MHVTENPGIMAPKMKGLFYLFFLLDDKSRNRQLLASAQQFHSSKVNIFAIPLASPLHLQNGCCSSTEFLFKKTSFFCPFHKESKNFPLTASFSFLFLFSFSFSFPLYSFFPLSTKE